jgi:hypothetical protein
MRYNWGIIPSLEEPKMSASVIAPPDPAVAPRSPLFPTLHLDTFRPLELCFGLLLALATNRWRQRTFAPTHLREVLRALRYALKGDPLMDEVADRCGAGVARQQLLLRVQISFWAHVLGLPVQEVCQWAQAPETRPLAQALGLAGAYHPQRIAELHAALGPVLLQQVYSRSKELLRQQLGLDGLTEDDLARTSAAQTFEPLALAMGRQYGFSYFVNFLFWQGIFARLEAALNQELKPNGYSLIELVAAYFRRFDTQATTPEALAEWLHNEAWAPASEQTVAPVSQTLRNFLAKLKPEQVILLFEAQARRALRRQLQAKGRRTRLTVAVDATLLPLFGAFEQAESLFDHVTQRGIQGYKLYVILEVQSRQPLAFVLHEPAATRADGEPKGDADYLAELVAHVKTALGVDHLAYVLFDKGFWSQAEFQRLVTADETLVTPGKQFKTIRETIATIRTDQWVRVAENQRVADVTVTFDNGLTLRLIVWKTLGRQVVRNERGNPKRDQDGKPLYRWRPIYHTYVTNIAADEMEAPAVVGLYGQRWSIEDFFEQMDNQYFLGHLPSTDLAVVKVHIALTFLGYILLREFQQLVADWLHNAEYATMELRRFARRFLRAPIAWLQWLKERQPGQRRPRLRRRYRDFVSSLANFGDPATKPESL